MSLLQEQLIKNLPKNNYNISKTAREVGYSLASSRSGTVYQSLRNHARFKEYFTADSVKRDIRKVKKLVLKKEDYTNYIRATELESKILGLQIDKTEVTNKNPEKIVVAYGGPQNTVNITAPDADVKVSDKD